VALITAAALAGLRPSQWLNSLLVAGALLSLVLFVLGAFSLPALPAAGALPPTGPGALAQATALLFVAYTGYGRIATMGQEVLRPERTIPRAVLLTLAGVLLNLVLGLSRVWLAKGRRGDMPPVLAALNESGTSPQVARMLSGLLIALLSLGGRLELTWAFSAFTVLGV
jgi:APA family basic amino acid/polyamine antiporter